MPPTKSSPAFLDGEFVTNCVQGVRYFVSGWLGGRIHSFGTLHLTNYRLMLVREAVAHQPAFLQATPALAQLSLPLAAIKVAKPAPDDPLALLVTAKDMRGLRIVFSSNPTFVATLQQLIMSRACTQSPTDHFALSWRSKPPLAAAAATAASDRPGWQVFDAEVEYLRLGLLAGPEQSPSADAAASAAAATTAAASPSPLRRPRGKAGQWRLYSSGYEAARSYPRRFLVPLHVSDAEVVAAAKHRSRGRMPTACWRDLVTGAVLARAAQPLSGVQGARCPEDEMLLRCIAGDFVGADAAAARSAAPAPMRSRMRAGGSVAEEALAVSDTLEAVGEAEADGAQRDAAAASSGGEFVGPVVTVSRSVVILDARPAVVVLGNQIAGKGLELGSGYGSKQVVYAGIQNIHAVRSSWEELRLLLHPPEMQKPQLNSSAGAVLSKLASAAASSSRSRVSGTQRNLARPASAINSGGAASGDGGGGGGGSWWEWAAAGIGWGGNGGGAGDEESVGSGSVSSARDTMVFGTPSQGVVGLGNSLDFLLGPEMGAGGQWGQRLEASGWLRHVRQVLAAGVYAARLLRLEGFSVLVHCSDGWDRTAQVCSVAEVLLDSFYRTIRGFAVLVEKEWLGFGHQFQKRCGHVTPVDAADDGRQSGSTAGISGAGEGIAGSGSGSGSGGTGASALSAGYSSDWSPVFVLFLDVLHNVIKQFPDAFEYTEELLCFVADHSYSCLFGTFLCDHEAARVALRLPSATASIWEAVLSPAGTAAFANRTYKAEAFPGPLWPTLAPHKLRLWERYFCRWDASAQPHPAAGDAWRDPTLEITAALEAMDLSAGGDVPLKTASESTPGRPVDAELQKRRRSSSPPQMSSRTPTTAERRQQRAGASAGRGIKPLGAPLASSSEHRPAAQQHHTRPEARQVARSASGAAAGGGGSAPAGSRTSSAARRNSSATLARTAVARAAGAPPTDSASGAASDTPKGATASPTSTASRSTNKEFSPASADTRRSGFGRSGA